MKLPVTQENIIQAEGKSCARCINLSKRNVYNPIYRRGFMTDVCSAQQYEDVCNLRPAHSCEFYTAKRGWLYRFFRWIW